MEGRRELETDRQTVEGWGRERKKYGVRERGMEERWREIKRENQTHRQTDRQTEKVTETERTKFQTKQVGLATIHKRSSTPRNKASRPRHQALGNTALSVPYLQNKRVTTKRNFISHGTTTVRVKFRNKNGQ